MEDEGRKLQGVCVGEKQDKNTLLGSALSGGCQHGMTA
jgi:hypothetical protein